MKYIFHMFGYKNEQMLQWFALSYICLFYNITFECGTMADLGFLKGGFHYCSY